MRTRFSVLTLTILAGALLSGCAGQFKQEVNFNPDEPLRVAVLPFISVDDKGNISKEEGRLFVDNLGLVSSKVDQTPPQIVRKQVYAELAKTKLDLISPALVDIDLPHRGFARTDGSIDLEKLMATKPIDLCTSFLNCDAILYGKVTKWDRSYYGIQSVNAVAIELKLVAAKDGKVLFSATGDDSESRGLTKIPTGYSSIVLEPIRGLDSEIISNLSRSIVQQMLAPLRATQRPEFLESAPPAIFSASNDGPLVPGRPLIVVFFGTPHSTASFSIGDTILHVPMVERDPGHYYGEYLPLPEDSFKDAAVTVTLTDRFARTSEERIERAGLSHTASTR